MADFNPAWKRQFKPYEEVPSSLSELDPLLQELERAIGAQLPQEYLTFIANVNGGQIVDNVDTFITCDPTRPKMLPERLSALFGLYKLPENKEYDLRENYKKYADRICSDFLPIGITTTGNIVCMSIDPMRAEKVYLWVNGSYRNGLLSLNFKKYENIIRNNETFKVDGPDEYGQMKVTQVKFRPTFSSMHFVDDGFSLFLSNLFHI